MTDNSLFGGTESFSPPKNYTRPISISNWQKFELPRKENLVSYIFACWLVIDSTGVEDEMASLFILMKLWRSLEAILWEKFTGVRNIWFFVSSRSLKTREKYTN